jgi:hypothetical protein
VQSPEKLCSYPVALLLGLGALTVPGAAYGQSGSPAAESAGATQTDDQGKEKPPESGYIPGDRRAVSVGLSPYAPQTPALPGGLTTPFAAPGPADEWTFNFRGYLSAALRVGEGARANPAPGQSAVTFHTLPRIVDSYGTFSGTNSPQGSWVDLTFEYGNSFVTSHVKITSWRPSDGTDWTAVGSQNFVDEAYLAWNLVSAKKFRLKWTTGAFRNTYGGLGQYSVGQYNAQIIGMPFGVGETLTAQYDIDDTYTVHFEDGLMGRLAKTPAGVVPLPENGGANPALPSSWVHHVHAGLARRGDVPLVLGIHYLTNWAQDERDQQDDPRTTWINEAQRPDPRMDVYGIDLRMLDNYLGNFAIAASYADAKYAALLTGMNYFGSYSGEQMTKRFFGPQGGGTAKMFVAGFEYVLSWGRLLRHPADFDGQGPDLTTSIFADADSISSKDPDADGRRMVKFGAEVTYRFFSWLALTGRADHVVPNSKDSQETFNVISPKLIFKSDWLSHEQVTLGYTRWFYGAHTHAEFPDDFVRSQLDTQMYSLTCAMWF